MANRTVNLYAQNFGYIYGGEPYETHPVSGNSFWNVEAGRGNVLRALFVQFQPMPDALRRKKLVSMSITFRARCTLNSDLYTGGTIKIKRLADVGATFDPSTITYANAPEIETSPFLQTVISGGTTPVVREYTEYLFQESATLGADFFARNRTLVFTSDYSNSVSALEISTRLADGTTPLYVTVTYDDAVDVEPRMWLFEPEHKIDPVYGGMADVMSFRFAGQLSAISADNEWLVRSIELFYRKWGTQNYTQVHADAADLRRKPLVEDYWDYLIPPYMLDAGSRYEWYVIISDTEGNVWRPNEVGTAGDGTGTRQDDTATFWTNDLVLSWIYYPTGETSRGRLDNAVPHTIRWKLRTEGYDVDVVQDSARLYWREDGETTYHAILFSGPDKTVSLPAYSFPAGKTITYYLSATGCGYTAQTETTTLETYDYSMQLYEYPQGNNVCPGDVLSFTYTLQTTTGTDVDVVSSTLYWREGTGGSYASITNTGSEKVVYVPANTIPTGISVQWYLEATAPDGTTKTTAPRSFSTASSQITPQASPTGGYMDPRDPITFSWYLAAGDGSVAQASASLFWKLSTSESFTEVQAGTANSVTIPANTFPVASTIQWYLSGEDYNGQSSQTNTFEFSTAAAEIRTITKYPVNGTIDGSVPITFRWEFDTADGSPPSRVEFAWKLPSESELQWHVVTDTTDAITEYTIAGGTFQPGQIDWRIRAWNIDSVLGREGTASFINLIAPTITTASATAVPFSTIAWQCDDQQSYEIEIDGERIGPYFGTEKRYILPDYFKDGVHSIRIRVMGSIGLWSQWVETTVDIHNVSEDEIQLTGTGPVEAALQWATDSGTEDFLVYRDGIMIGHTEKSEFSDRFANGEHTYVVINRLPSGNYDKSNEATIELSVPRMTLAAIDGEEWLEIPHALTSQRDPEYTKTKTVVFNHLSGHDYPTAITSELYEAPMSATAAFLFTETEAHKKFLKLFGIPIIVKAVDGSCFVGIISSWRQQPRQGYYTAYTFTVNKIDWEDYIDDTE